MSVSNNPLRVTRLPARLKGVTLVELLVALVLAALIVLASTAMVVTSRTSYRTQDETTRLAESSRFALELVNRMVRLTGYTNFGDDTGIPAFFAADPTWNATIPGAAYATNGPNLVGAVNSTPFGSNPFASDSLVIRYFGANQPTDKDFGSILDCAGYPVPQPTGAPASSLASVNRNSRAFSILYVAPDTDGEPALWCQRQMYNITSNPGVIIPGGDAQVLIRGVERFRVLYGEALYGALDPDTNPIPALAYRNGIGTGNQVLNWDNVVTVKIAMLMRSAPGSRADLDSSNYDLFGNDYVGIDSTTRFPTAGLTPATERSRSRRIVQTTIFVRNRLANWPSLKVE